MQFPQDFLDKMQALLGDEFTQFRESLDAESARGLRVNSLRISEEDFLKLSPWALESIPWTQLGFFYREADRPGRHIYHDAGLYYIQEPSAMAIAEILGPQPGEWVLDLAAAPGGKSTHIAALMNGKGLLVANEIHSGRAQILAQNIERLGITNTVVLNETPERLAEFFGPVFDRILVDAPCSGEGMFRKNPLAVSEWSLAHVASCAVRQGQILDQVPHLLKPGGYLVYSTCTFSPEENEDVIAEFLARHEDFELAEIRTRQGFAPGQLPGTVRLWPHRLRGEGHFAALLRRREDAPVRARRLKRLSSRTRESDVGEYLEFAGHTLKKQLSGEYLRTGDHLYLVPAELPELQGLRVIRTGLQLGIFKKRRFEPAHALSHALKAADVEYAADFASGSNELERYMRGETLPFEGPDGWYLVAVEGFGLGWAKLVKGVLKNHLPKGLRQP